MPNYADSAASMVEVRKFSRSMAAAALFRGFGRLQFRDFHAKFVRTFNEMFPLERARPLSGELVVKWHRIVVIQQDEMIADGQLKPGLNNQAMFDRTGNRAHVHDFVRADEVGCLQCWIHVCFFVG